MDTPVDAWGDIAYVWTWQAFVFAFIAGMGFGYVVLSRVALHPRWRTKNRAGIIGWATAILSVGWILTMVLSQVAASIAVNDQLWVRIFSRLFPYIAGAIGTGIGTGIGVWWRHRK